MQWSQRALRIEAGLPLAMASPGADHYEEGKHMPNLRSLELLGNMLDTPAPYSYPVDDALTDAVELLARIPSKDKKEAVSAIRERDEQS